MRVDAGKTASKQLYLNKADKICFDNCKFENSRKLELAKNYKITNSRKLEHVNIEHYQIYSMIQIEWMHNVISPHKKISNKKIFGNATVQNYPNLLKSEIFFHCFLYISYQTHIVTSQPFAVLHIAPLLYFFSQWRIHCDTVDSGVWA